MIINDGLRFNYFDDDVVMVSVPFMKMVVDGKVVSDETIIGEYSRLLDIVNQKNKDNDDRNEIVEVAVDKESPIVFGDINIPISLKMILRALDRAVKIGDVGLIEKLRRIVIMHWKEDGFEDISIDEMMKNHGHNSTCFILATEENRKIDRDIWFYNGENLEWINLQQIDYSDVRNRYLESKQQRDRVKAKKRCLSN